MTLGMLKIVEEDHPPIFTLENPWRKTPKDSRIPYGEYQCEPYSGTKYKDVYIVNDVPGRSAILFHWGNYESDTEGCILVGLGAGEMNNRPAITHSKAAFKIFRRLIGDEPFHLIINRPLGVL